jgi:putative sigma-54 modulation protein
MNMVVTGRNIELTPALKDYLTDKLRRAQKHFDHPLDVAAMLSVAKNPSIPQSQTAEVMVKVNGNLIRGEESTENMYASIDLVANKIERQLRKFKTRHYHKGNKLHGISIFEAGLGDISSSKAKILRSSATQLDNGHEALVQPQRTGPRLVRTKRFTLKPMLPDDAATHMDLLGHDFYMFLNAESNQVNTVYHRRDGNYGLIEPI